MDTAADLPPIIDAHFHLWDTAKLNYPWLSGIPALASPYSVHEYTEACGGEPIVGMVFLQCECEPRQYPLETQWITSLARSETRLRGIVSYAPLEKGEQAIDDLTELAQNQLVKGIRRIIQYESDPTFCLRPAFIRGVQTLADFRLTFDICVAHDQLRSVLEMVRQCPEVTFVLDHLGKPNISAKQMEPWAKDIADLAGMPNIWCKVSGLVTEAGSANCAKESLRPYIDHVLNCFGFDRVMFGSDWPVVTTASTLTWWIETLKWCTADCTTEDKRRLFHDNATNFYRL